MNKTALEFEKKANASALLKLAFLQAFGSVVFSLGLWYCFDAREALSGLFGGLTATTMSLFMAARLFAVHRLSKLRPVAPGEALVRFYITAILKIIFTLAMMVIFIVVIEVSILPFIISYLIAAVIVNLLYIYLEAKEPEEEYDPRVS